MTLDELVAQAQAVATGAQAHAGAMAAYAPPPPLTAQLVADAEGLGSSAAMYAASLAAYRDSLIVQVPPPATLTLVRKGTHPQHNVQFSPIVMTPDTLRHVFNGHREYDPATGAMSNVTVTMADGSPPIVNPENYDMCLADGLVYQGTAAPVGLFSTFDPATRVVTNLPFATAGRQGFVYDPADHAIYCVGGSASGAAMKRLQLPTTPGGQPGPLTTVSKVWKKGGVTIAAPLTNDYSKNSFQRRGIASTGRIGIFVDGNDLYETERGAPEWFHKPYTGSAPLRTLWRFYEPLDSYIGWCNVDAPSGGGTLVQKWYRLNRSTWTCEELPVANSSPVPKAKSMGGNALTEDVARQQMLLLVDDETSMFALDLRGLL